MSVKTYNTFVREFANMADAVNRANGAYDYARNGGSNGEGSAPRKRVTRLPIDAWANEESFTIKSYLPGVSLDDVEITFEGEELTIRGHYPESEMDVNFVTRELFNGEFERRLTFNVPVNVDEIEATFENGVLVLSVPKAEEIRPRQIKVQAK
jgi:HSP20 family protein